MSVVEALTGRGLVVTGHEVGVRVDGVRPDPARSTGRGERTVVFEPALDAGEIERTLRREYLPRLDPSDPLPVFRYAAIARPLTILTLIELLPIVRAVEEIAPDGVAGQRAAREDLSGLPDRGVSLSEVLTDANFPLGFVIGPTGDVFRVTSQTPARPCVGTPHLQIGGLRRTAIRQLELRRRLEKVLARMGDTYKETLAAFVRARWSVSSPQLQGTEPLYRGKGLQVWIEKDGERVTVRRRVGRFTLRTRTVKRTFRPVEFRVPVELGDNGLECGQPWIDQKFIHPFVGNRGEICLDGFSPTDDSRGRRVLAVVERTESVLVNPSNPSGVGGLRRLSECPNS